MLLEDPISTWIHNCGGCAVLGVRGDIDVASESAFKSAIGEALAGHPQALVIDLLNVGFLGSVGIRVLLEAQERVGDDNRFAVVARGPAAGRILQLLDFDELLAVHTTVEEALSWVSGLSADAHRRTQ